MAEPLVDTLMALERRFWEASSAGSGAAVVALLADGALTAGTFGVLDAAATARAADGQPSFEYYRVVGEPQAAELTSDCAVVVYRATAKRRGKPEFSAIMSSTYVRRDGVWQLAFHHQTQVPGG